MSAIKLVMCAVKIMMYTVRLKLSSMIVIPVIYLITALINPILST